MPFFSRQVADLTTEDIFELLEAGARENIRLEFKREMPTRDELLKKLSGFANTYGGHLLIGAAEDKRGELSGLPGIDPQPSFDQQVASWCFEGVYPPIVPDISAPIPHPQDPAKVFYVIYVGESLATPHFLEARGGCWVRTGEYSQRPKEGLATYEEIEHLADRRRRAVELRDRLLDRAAARFGVHGRHHHLRTGNEVSDTTISIALLPAFPAGPPLAHEALRAALPHCRRPARGVWIPEGEPRSQAEGFYYGEPRGVFSYLECDIHRLIYYAQETRPESDRSDPMVYLNHILGWVIFYLEFGNRLYQQVGYDGLLRLEIDLGNVPNRDVFIEEGRRSGRRLRPQLDSSLSLVRTVPTSTLRQNQFDLVTDVLQEICFGLGHPGAFASREYPAHETVIAALDYLGWRDNHNLPPGYPELF